MVNSVYQHLGYLVNGERLPTDPMPTLQTGVVISADATGVRFAIPAFDPDRAFGPARFGRPSTAVGYPPAGTACLVAFAGEDLADPWVVTFAGWPA